MIFAGNNFESVFAFITIYNCKSLQNFAKTYQKVI